MSASLRGQKILRQRPLVKNPSAQPSASGRWSGTSGHRGPQAWLTRDTGACVCACFPHFPWGPGLGRTGKERELQERHTVRRERKEERGEGKARERKDWQGEGVRDQTLWALLWMWGSLSHLGGRPPGRMETHTHTHSQSQDRQPSLWIVAWGPGPLARGFQKVCGKSTSFHSI